MPLYEFRCLECGKIIEEFASLDDCMLSIRPPCHPKNWAKRNVTAPKRNRAMQSMADLDCVFVDQYADFVQRKPKESFNPKTKKWEKR